MLREISLFLLRISVNSWQEYWLPWSEWKIIFPVIGRFQTAIIHADIMVSAADTPLLMDQPITFLSYRSIRDIRNCEPAYMEVYGTESKFGLSEYKDSTGRTLSEYLLTKSQTLFLVSGYDAVIRARIQKRWKELEVKYKIPQSYAEALKLAAKQAEAIELKEKENIQRQQENDLKEAKNTNHNLQNPQAASKPKYHDELIWLVYK